MRALEIVTTSKDHPLKACPCRRAQREYSFAIKQPFNKTEGAGKQEGSIPIFSAMPVKDEHLYFHAKERSSQFAIFKCQ